MISTHFDETSESMKYEVASSELGLDLHLELGVDVLVELDFVHSDEDRVASIEFRCE